MAKTKQEVSAVREKARGGGAMRFGYAIARVREVERSVSEGGLPLFVRQPLSSEVRI